MSLGIVIAILGILTLALAYAARRSAPSGDFARWRLFTGPTMILAGLVIIAADAHLF